MIASHRLRADLLRLLAVGALCLASVAQADTAVQNGNFSFNHSSAVSSGAVSVAGTYTHTDTASPSALSFNQFNPGLGTLTQVTVSVTTSTATFAIAPSGVLALISTGSATRKLEYLVTAGATTGGDNNQVVTSGVTLVTLLGTGSAEIGGAPLAKSTSFTVATDLARFTGSGTVSVGITSTDTLSVTTLLSLFNGAGFSGSGTYAGTVSVTYTYTPWALSGNVYHDVDHNGFRDSTETGTGLTLYAKALLESSPAGPALQAVTVNSSSGAFSISLSRGTYRILIDDNATLSDVTPLVTPTGWTATQAPTFLRTSVGVDGDLSGQDFGLIHATTLCGRAFTDDGSGSGVANDGVINGAEAGMGGQTLRLLDSGNSVLDTTTTSSQNGSYCLHIPYTVANGAPLRAARTLTSAYLATSASAGTSSGSYSRSTDSLTFANITNQNYTGVNFGSVAVPTLLGAAEQGGTPSSVLWFSHRYTSTSTGQVTLSVSDVSNPVIPNLSETIYLDSNANGRIDSGEPPITAPVAVTTGSVTWILIRVAIPQSAPPLSRARVNLQADMSFSNASPSLVYTLTTTDIANVLSATSSGLQLTKSVDKASATPGATLVYTIAFANTGITPIQQLVINDATPPYTTFVASSGVSIPTALGTMTTTAPAVGAAGSLRWSFPGQLAPGLAGSIQFSVVITP